MPIRPAGRPAMVTSPAATARVSPDIAENSSAWPFPATLMIGCTARATSDAIEVDAHEIGEAHWFTRDELRAIAPGGSVQLPRGDSVARRMIEGWIRGEA